MRKTTIILYGILLMLFIPSCYQYIFIPINGNNNVEADSMATITDVDTLRTFMEQPGSGRAYLNIRINVAEEELPIYVNGTKETYGYIEIDASSSNGRAVVTDTNVSPAKRRSVFEIRDNADITINNLSVDIMESVIDEIDAVFSLNDARISATELNITIPETRDIAGIYIGETAHPEKITLKDSAPGKITISPKNEHDTEILEKIDTDNEGNDQPIKIETKYDAVTADEFFSKLESYGHVRLTSNLSLTADNVPADIMTAGTNGTNLLNLDRSYLIDLNEHKLSSSLLFRLTEANATDTGTPAYTVQIEDGALEINKPNATSGNWNLGAIQLFGNSSVSLDHVKYTSNITGIVTNGGSSNITVDIANSNIDVGGYYCISTNASTESGDVSRNVEINVTDSTLNSENTWSSMGILFNIPGDLTISGTTITALSQVVIARGGTHNYSDSTFISTGENQFNATNSDFSKKDWADGNSVPLAALVIGNRGNGYAYPTDVTLDNVVIQAPVQSIHSDPLEYHGMYIWQNNTTNTVTVRGSVIESADSVAEPFINTDMNGADITALNITRN